MCNLNKLKYDSKLQQPLITNFISIIKTVMTILLFIIIFRFNNFYDYVTTARTFFHVIIL